MQNSSTAMLEGWIKGWTIPKACQLSRLFNLNFSLLGHFVPLHNSQIHLRNDNFSIYIKDKQHKLITFVWKLSRMCNLKALLMKRERSFSSCWISKAFKWILISWKDKASPIFPYCISSRQWTLNTDFNCECKMNWRGFLCLRSPLTMLYLVFHFLVLCFNDYFFPSALPLTHSLDIVCFTFLFILSKNISLVMRVLLF